MYLPSASSPGHSKILSCSRGEKIFSTATRKIWEWPGDEANQPYCLCQACCTCGQLKNVIMQASLRFPLLSYLFAKQTTKFFNLVCEEPNRLYIIPAVFLSLQWLVTSWCRLCVRASTLQRNSIFYAISMTCLLPNMCLLVSCYQN